jgi:hypothetical protein
MTLNEGEVLSVKKYADELGVPFKLGERMRATLEGEDSPSAYELPEDRRSRLIASDPELNSEACAKPAPGACRSGETTFHIDAYGMLQLCSGNRADGYDLRAGSFREGFYERLPKFRCARKTAPLVQLSVLSNHG